MNRAAVASVSLAGLLLLCGCAGGEPSGAPSPSSTATVSATPTPSASAAPATEPPALAELVLSPEGLGSLVVGQTPPAVNADTDLLVHSSSVCQWAVDDGYRESAAMWVANYEPAISGKGPSPFGVWVDDTSEQLLMLAVYDESIATSSGIHLRSSASDVAAAYPGADLLEEYDSGDTHVYKIAGTAGDLYIDVLKAESVPIYPEVGAELVVRLNVVAKGQSFVGFNSDFVLGLCVSP